MKSLKRFFYRKMAQLSAVTSLNKQTRMRRREYYDDKIITLFDEKIRSFIDRYPKVLSEEETLELIVTQRQSICRYGDGEFKLIIGERHKAFQDVNEALNARLVQILKSQDSGILVGINNITHTRELGRVWSKFIIRIGEEVLGLLDRQRVYASSEVFRQLPDDSKSAFIKRVRDIKRVWQDRKVVFVVGRNSRFFFEDDLFENMASVDYVYAPAKNAFNEYDDIFDAVKAYDKTEYLMIVVLGPTATVMAYDLAKEGYQAIDFGQMPSIYKRTKLAVFGDEDISDRLRD